LATEFGGGIFCDWSSNAQVSNSIFDSSSSYAVYEEQIGGDSSALNCLFNDNQSGDYYDAATGSAYTGAIQVNSIAGNSGNLDGDPVFVAGIFGNFYLDQLLSPAVDAGNDTAVNLGMNVFTTDPCQVTPALDTGDVDLGYHYDPNTTATKYLLTVTVVGGHGLFQIDPVSVGGDYTKNSLVKIEAIPDPGWRIAEWAGGTIDDVSKVLVNFVLMDSDKNITIEFEQPRTLEVGSKIGQYTTFQHAIDAADDGDTVLIPTGVYDPSPTVENRIYIFGKDITITSVNPNDPCVVAQTILDDGWRFFIGNVGPGTIIDGLTIQNSNWSGISPDPPDYPADGYNGGSLFGGAMRIYSGSPTIRNCRFVDCSATGGNGSVGIAGNDDHKRGYDGGWGGKAHGGAVFVDADANPTFIKTTFIGCLARGGNGGNGGAGVDEFRDGRGGNWQYAPSIEELWESFSFWDGWEWGPYDDYWMYSGYGGAVYCDDRSSPKFIDCEFTDNRTYGGVTGRGEGTWLEYEEIQKIENAGGAVYARAGSSPEFTNCTFSGNLADRSFDYAGSVVADPQDYYLSYGGAIAYELDSAPVFTDCKFVDNRACIGGAMFWDTSEPTITGCEFIDNTAYHGAGLYSVDSTGTIDDCNITGNIASSESDDPCMPADVDMIFGQGGGYFCFSSIVNITDSSFKQNVAEGSGGAIYYGGSDESSSFTPILHNNMIRGNTAGRDGGGISANWYAEPRISNCTIVDNTVTGAFSSEYGYGGGLACGYYSNPTVIDSIIWANDAVSGAQIFVGYGEIYASGVNVTYSDVGPEYIPVIGGADSGDGGGGGAGEVADVLTITTTNDAEELVNNILGSGITVSNLSYTGAGISAGTFVGGQSAGINIESGIILTCGDAALAVPPNQLDGSSANNGLAGDTDLNTLIPGYETNDATILEFDFVSDGGDLYFEYVFASEEYNEYTNSSYNDVFGFFLDGENIALIPGRSAQVSINNVNGGNPIGTEASNADLYNNNDLDDGGPNFAIEYDGFTDVFVASKENLSAGVHHIKLAIADAGDSILDSAVFILAGSFADTLTPSYSNRGYPVYVEDGCLLNGQVYYDFDPNTFTWDAATHNINEDPNFIGDYFLSQILAGQSMTSPCVDTGSDLAANVGLDTYTTRTDSIFDACTVDMGYHHKQFDVTQYQLDIVFVTDTALFGPGGLDPCDFHVTPLSGPVNQYTQVPLSLVGPVPFGYGVKWTGTDDDGSHSQNNVVTILADKTVIVEIEEYAFELVLNVGDGGSVTVTSDPNGVNGLYPPGTVVHLTAIPDPCSVLWEWRGTDNDILLTHDNTVTMTGDKTVNVEFIFDISRELLVPGVYDTIEEAFADARDGDRIILEERADDPYLISNPGGIDFAGKAVTIMSSDPDDPCTIANTVIDCQGTRYFAQRAFHFQSGETSDTRLWGLTIKNGFMAGDIGENASVINTAYPPTDDDAAPNRASSGADAAGDGYGGAILCENGSSPTIRNCVFIDCTVAGGIGGDGADGYYVAAGVNLHGQSGGHGGTGTGIGYGGAIACTDADTNPVIDNCTFIGNNAVGGWGGNGGNGSERDLNSSGNESWGGNGGNGIGDGRGGSIYIGAESLPIITDCVFENNHVQGVVGRGGLRGPGSLWGSPWDNPGAQDGSDGLMTSYGLLAGGAIYCEDDSKPILDNFNFSNNAAYEKVFYNDAGELTEGDSYVKAGALYIGVDADVNMVDCEFTNNGGGAIYSDDKSNITIKNCLFSGNFNYDKSNTDYIANIYNPDTPLAPEASHLVQGGAIFLGLDGDASIQNSDFFANYTYGVGGAINSKGRLDIEGCSFGSNSALGDGGAIDSYIYPSDPVYVTTTLILVDCIFANNKSGQFGGALRAKEFEAWLTDCYLIGNTAQSGGALHFADGQANIDGGLIRANNATGILLGLTGSQTVNEGFGGGVACIGASATIQNCVITENAAGGGNGFGGGICFYGGGGVIEHYMKNCLVESNTSAALGGGLACGIYTTPVLDNCTFSGNTAVEFGGSIFCDWSSNVQVNNSIFVSSSNYAVYEEQIGGDSFSLSCLYHENQPADFYDAATGLAYTGATEIDSIAGNLDNHDGDPHFETGPYGDFYLNQALSFANCTGNATAASLGMDMFTTDPCFFDPIPDTGTVDIGYHYSLDVSTKYTLTTVVYGDGHGSLQIEPVTAGNEYFAGTVVKITATPDTGYRLASWSGGTMDDGTTKLVNYVLMDSDKTITIKCDQTETLLVGSKPEYTSIRRTIELSKEGDVVIIPTGEWNPSWPFVSILLSGKNITITGINPDDPEIVANTIINNQTFVLNNLTQGTIIEGLTFVHQADMDPCTTLSLLESSLVLVSSDIIVRNCVFRDSHHFGGNGLDGPSCSDGPRDGFNGGNAFGGAIQMYDSSPDVLNCEFRDLWATGGDGGKGTDGCTGHCWGWDGGWSGRGYGGAVYCAFYSSPTFVDCTFTDCLARGGDGGDGGSGACGPPIWPGGRGGTWTWVDYIEARWRYSYTQWPDFVWEGWQWGDKDGGDHGWYGYFSWYDGLYNYYPDYDPYDAYYDYWDYSGYGGAVFIEDHSSPKFTNCEFTNNSSFGGVSGVGGAGPPSWPPSPEYNYNLENAGGAVFAREFCNPEFTNCQFTGNSADTSTVYMPDDYYVSFGGGLAFEDNCFPKFTNCDIDDNTASLGGGIYWMDSAAEITDSNIVDNSAYSGGGLYSGYSSGTVTNSNLIGNTATNFYQPDPCNPSSASLIRGEGGGFFCFSSIVDIADSVFRTNNATGSGGGLYLGGSDGDTQDEPTVHNSLFADNVAGHDGGAISVDWYCQPIISSCTIARNRTTGMESLGGGLFVSYDSYVDLIDSIIWTNNAGSGSQIAVGSGDPYGPRPSTLNITYSDIGPAYDPNNVLLPEWAQTQSDDPFAGQGQLTGVAVITDEQTIYDEFDAGAETVKVIVSLVDPTQLKQATNWNSAQSLDILRTEIIARQDQVLLTLATDEFTIRHRYENQAGFSGEITSAGLDKLLTNPSVVYIEPVRKLYPALAQAIPLGNAMETRETYDGSGVSVAIVDTGVDYTHPMLGGGGLPNDKVIGGYDTGESDSDPIPVGEAHGTCCAGISAGDLGEVGDYIGGVAPTAKIYALKASPDDAGYFFNDATLAAWDWCISHRNDDPQNPILIISNSWGGSMFNDSQLADNYSPAHTTSAANATAVGITILAASGNDGFAGQGISWPAAMSKVISVGAVYDATDEVTEYSNTAEILDILAPADPVYTTDIVGADGYDEGDYYPLFNGTSSACPFAAGAVAAMQNAALKLRNGYLTPDEVKTLLTLTGDLVTDGKVNITKPRVNLGGAISSITYGPPIYIEDGCILNGQTIADFDPNIFIWDAATHNIEEDPLFIGDYFLRQTLAGQLEQSSCVDAGSGLAASVGLADYTTRTDSVTEADTDPNLDMGYHHKQFTVPMYELTATFVEVDGFIGDITIDPSSDIDGKYKQYTQVRLSVDAPDCGFHIRWIGTDDDESAETENVVTMDANKEVLVTYVPSTRLTVRAKAVDTNGDGEPNEIEVDFVEPEPFCIETEYDSFTGDTIYTVYYDQDDEVTMHAYPVPGDIYEWDIVWSDTNNGDVLAIDPNYTVIVKSSTDVTVTYKEYEPEYYAVICGISSYSSNYLPTASNDAIEFEETLLKGQNWQQENITLLTDSSATKSSIKNAIEDMAEKLDENDVFIFYFAGHGTTGADISPIDEIDGFDEYLVAYLSQNISDDEMSDWLNALPTDDYIVILDTAFFGSSGSQSGYVLSRGLGSNVPDEGDGFADDISENGVVVTAAGVQQYCWENAELSHGIFTYYLLQAMRSRADRSDLSNSIGDDNGWISIEECYYYAGPRVSEYVYDLDGAGMLNTPAGTSQDPNMIDSDDGREIEFIELDESSTAPRIIRYPGDADSIQEAIGMANDGDMVEILPGVHYGGELIIDKEITIRGTNPDDPCVVAATIIDCAGYVNRGVIFTGSAGEDTTLNGITIINGTLANLPGDDGEQPTEDNPNSNPDGQDGGSLQGGGIYCSTGSAPTIRNCVIRNCGITGGNAGNGAAADENNNAGRGGWGGWARGGGVFIARSSSPTFINTTIRDCFANGGNGGNGGDYAEGDGYYSSANYGGLWSNDFYASWQDMTDYYGRPYIGNYRFYSGYGGGVYCSERSSPTFIACTITGNTTRGGMSGIGGARQEGAVRAEPVFSYEIPTYGGGVYCAKNSDVVFEDCTISDNISAKPSFEPDSIEVDPDTGVITGTPVYHLDPYLGHGGGVAFEETSSITFDGCIVTGNVASCGGGLYMVNDNLTVRDCVVKANQSYQGGGIFATHGIATIERCSLSENFAGNVNGDVDEIAGQGGAIYCASINVGVFDCNILNNEASASGGGLFITGGDANSPVVKNCLFAFNIAGRDGGGISVNWYSTPEISNCTIFENRVTGIFSEEGFGGGLYTSYHSDSQLFDSILWGNAAETGRQIAVGTGFEFDPRPSSLIVSHCDIQGGKSDTAAYYGYDCTLTWLGGVINEDPLFVPGPFGKYYLSQIAAGQAVNSPCVDTGSTFAGDVDMHEYVTRNDDSFTAFDKDLVDMGYHYPPAISLDSCRSCDLVFDGIINFADFEIFADHWLDDCATIDCQGASFTVDDTVDMLDLDIFAGCWLVMDDNPPEPDAAEWWLLPNAVESSSTQIDMMAKESYDIWSEIVEYQFECIEIGNTGTPGHLSPWQSDPCWSDTGLVSQTSYTYVVRTRDEWGNTTEDSIPASATAGEEIVPPYPDPARFANLDDDGYDGAPLPGNDPCSITMTAATVTDPEGNGVEYKFFCTTDIAFTSEWQASPTYVVEDLTIGTTYCFYVIVRDLSSNNNQTAQSDTLCSLAATQNYAPYPTGGEIGDDAAFDINPYRFPYLASSLHIMRATDAIDPEAGVIEYYFESDTCISSGWQESPAYEYDIGTSTPMNCSYRVKYRDDRGAESPFSDWVQVTN